MQQAPCHQPHQLGHAHGTSIKACPHSPAAARKTNPPHLFGLDALLGELDELAAQRALRGTVSSELRRGCQGGLIRLPECPQAEVARQLLRGWEAGRWIEGQGGQPECRSKMSRQSAAWHTSGAAMHERLSCHVGQLCCSQLLYRPKTQAPHGQAHSQPLTRYIFCAPACSHSRAMSQCAACTSLMPLSSPSSACSPASLPAPSSLPSPLSLVAMS